MKHIFAILILFFSISLLAKDYNVDTVAIFSEVLNEKREVFIFKPQELNPDDSISILYMLDGESSPNRYELVSKTQFNKPIIGIGIINTARRRDMLPKKQPDKFLEFIISELIPYIERDFLIDQRILFGHSFAGGFVIYSLIHKSELFDKYIASSPTPLINMVDSNIFIQLDSELKKGIKLYFSYGSKDLKQVITWDEKLLYNLHATDLKYIDWKNGIYTDENHITSVKISLIEGLRY